MPHHSRPRAVGVALALWLLGFHSGCSTPPSATAPVAASSERITVSIPEYHEGETFEPSGLVAAPILMTGGGTHEARALVEPNQRAVATLEYVVDESGQVIAARIIQTNHPAYAQRVLASLAQWRFHPGLKADQPVKVRVRKEFFVEVSRSSSSKLVERR